MVALPSSKSAMSVLMHPNIQRFVLACICVLSFVFIFEYFYD